MVDVELRLVDTVVEGMLKQLLFGVLSAAEMGIRHSLTCCRLCETLMPWSCPLS